MINKLLLTFIILTSLHAEMGAQDQHNQKESLNLYPLISESVSEVQQRDSLFGLLVSKVVNPTLTPFIPSDEKKNRSAVIICPGGGYHTLLMEREGFRVAAEFTEIGIAAFVLKYRLPSPETGVSDPFAPLQDAQRAIQMVRDNAAAWGINPSKVGIMGFSAGGHLAASLGVHYDSLLVKKATPALLRPDFLILINPVISFDDLMGHIGSRENLLGQKQDKEIIHYFSNHNYVNRNTPKTILFHTDDDSVVSVKNSFSFYDCLHHNSVPAELHIYSRGNHGFILFPEFEEWFPRLTRWMKREEIMD